MRNSKILKDLIDSDETLIMPDAYDPISAKIIEYMGFKAVQCSGFSFAISACRKNEADISCNENLSITSRIVDSVSIPVMADGEDGFGGLEQIPKTIKGYIKAGASGINMEDQVFDKKNRADIIECSLMLDKIKAAKNAAKLYGNPDLLINGRTDALSAFEKRKEGLSEAIKRANLYLEAGSDMVFVTKVTSLDEAKLLVKEINGPLSIAAGLSYNINNFSINDLKEIGIARVSLPTIAITAIVKSLLVTIDALKSGEFIEILDKKLLCTYEDIAQIMKM
jgi:2-methylisocitrate lyase-like PEP mutase family enzyme